MAILSNELREKEELTLKSNIIRVKAILMISIILILLDRSVFMFIEESLPYIKSIEKYENQKAANQSKREGMTSVEEEQRRNDDIQVESVTSADPNKDLSYSYESVPKRNSFLFLLTF